MHQRTQELFNAVIANDLQKVESFLEDFPSLARAVDLEGNMPLHMASSVAMVTMLTCYGADPSQPNNSGIYPDEAAIARGQQLIADTLRRYWPDAAKG